jgi:hypothetical protein
LVQALQDAKKIVSKPDIAAAEIVGGESRIGEWILLISPWGTYWVCTCLESGIPRTVLVFESETGRLVRDRVLMANLRSSDTSLTNLSFDLAVAEEVSLTGVEHESAVVEVEFGESWTDYRPSRPEHFVGRSKVQSDLVRFLTAVKTRRTDTRVFAIKGDSGIGKSSLIAKLRDRANRSKKPSSIFMFAVDVRAAGSPGYIHASLLTALKKAAERGFGTRESNSLRVTDVSDPLQSDSISQFLLECQRQKQLLVLVFDQFEELYSKPELFGVFTEARRIMLSAVSAGANFVLGFAWKTDSTVPQDHPAYYMWHQLSDHRFEATLLPFTHADAEKSLFLFERELGHKLRPELRKYIIEQSQGYPWLLKKLCIHVYEQLEGGASQSELADRSLDIGFLFDKDLSSLTQAEDGCMKLIARNAPVDWYEVIEMAGADVVRALQQKRLIIRRGDKLNVYWDIFREYVLSRSVPHIPLTYVPQSPSVTALLNVSSKLNPFEARKISQLGRACGYSDNTIRNIVHDLSEFGILSDKGSGLLLDSHITGTAPESVLAHIRLVLRRHALTAILRQQQAGAPISQDDMIFFLKRVNPTARHHGRTWRTYANRMAQWLMATGYLAQRGSGWIYEDAGEIRENYAPHSSGGPKEKRRSAFIGDAPPSRVIAALEFIKQNGQQPVAKLKSLGYRNACSVLYRFGLIEITDRHTYRITEALCGTLSSLQAVWNKAHEDHALSQIVQLLRENPSIGHDRMAQAMAKTYEREWTSATIKRIGNSLRHWATWVLLGEQGEQVPAPSSKLKLEKVKQLRLF